MTIVGGNTSSAASPPPLPSSFPLIFHAKTCISDLCNRNCISRRKMTSFLLLLVIFPRREGFQPQPSTYPPRAASRGRRLHETFRLSRRLASFARSEAAHWLGSFAKGFKCLNTYVTGSPLRLLESPSVQQLQDRLSLHVATSVILVQ